MEYNDVIKWISYLPEQTGIYCHNSKWAKNVFSDLLSFIPKEYVKQAHYKGGIAGINLSGNKSVRFVFPYESTYGLKFDRIYIDSDVEDKKYHNLIRRTIAAHMGEPPTVVWDAVGIIRGGIKANDYFTAEWIICSDGYYPYCSACGFELPVTFEKYPNRCPHCTAKMSNGESENQ